LYKIVRGEMPKFLQDNWRRWTNQYLKSNSIFQWATHKGKTVNQHLREPLLTMTDKHCSFCDGYPMGRMTRNTIEHFRPKSRSKYPKLAYYWTNLFIACDVCQEKNSDFDKLLLKPDALDYEFYKYFIFDSLSGEIKPNPRASKLNQDRAKITIKIYKLNENNLPEFRLEELNNNEEDFLSGKKDLSVLSYRFMYI